MLISLCAASVVAVIMKFGKKDEKIGNVDLRMAKKQDLFGAYYTLLAELRKARIPERRSPVNPH